MTGCSNSASDKAAFWINLPMTQIGTQPSCKGVPECHLVGTWADGTPFKWEQWMADEGATFNIALSNGFLIMLSTSPLIGGNNGGYMESYTVCQFICSEE